jgi:hypothetical protein
MDRLIYYKVLSVGQQVYNILNHKYGEIMSYEIFDIPIITVYYNIMYNDDKIIDEFVHEKYIEMCPIVRTIY